LPQARRDDLLVEEVEDELVIYDKRSDSGHRLNRTAAIVWRHCDGERDVEDLAAVLAKELGEDLADEDLVRIALDQLAENDLIEGGAEQVAEETMLSRRRFIRRVGTVGAAALALPVVTTINAPTAAAQGSPTCSYCYCCDPCCICCQNQRQGLNRRSRRR
jgi:hypothetical protein